MTTNCKGTYGKLQVWYLPEGIANIFSMHKLEKMYHITYNSWDQYYAVHMPRGEALFYKDKQGLPYTDLEGSDQDVAMMLVQEHVGMKKVNKCRGMSLVQTVHGNYKGYTKKELLQAKEARRAQAMLGNPSEKDFKGIASSNIIPNCPITHSNVTSERKIFSPNLASIRGKTVCRTPAPVKGDYVAIPREIVEANAAVTLAANVFFVDGTAFLTTVSRKVNLLRQNMCWCAWSSPCANITREFFSCTDGLVLEQKLF
jgi:hypothetical protein